MRRPSPSAVAIDAALMAAADAMREIALARRRPKTWRADLDALRRAVATLATARRQAGYEPAEPIGFTAEGSAAMAEQEPTAFDEGGEHPDHGLDYEHEHEHDRPGRDPR